MRMDQSRGSCAPLIGRKVVRSKRRGPPDFEKIFLSHAAEIFFTFLDQLKIILGRNLADEQKIRNIVKFIFLLVIFDETK